MSDYFLATDEVGPQWRVADIADLDDYSRDNPCETSSDFDGPVVSSMWHVEGPSVVYTERLELSGERGSSGKGVAFVVLSALVTDWRLGSLSPDDIDARLLDDTTCQEVLPPLCEVVRDVLDEFLQQQPAHPALQSRSVTRVTASAYPGAMVVEVAGTFDRRSDSLEVRDVWDVTSFSLHELDGDELALLLSESGDPRLIPALQKLLG